MKRFIVSISCAALLSISAAPVIAAIGDDLDENPESSETIKVKCHVALINGKEAISLWRVSADEFSTLKNSIVGKKILPHKSKEKVKVFRAYECITEEEYFSTLKARLLDKSMPR